MVIEYFNFTSPTNFIYFKLYQYSSPNSVVSISSCSNNITMYTPIDSSQFKSNLTLIELFKNNGVNVFDYNDDYFHNVCNNLQVNDSDYTLNDRLKYSIIINIYFSFEFNPQLVPKSNFVIEFGTDFLYGYSHKEIVKLLSLVNCFVVNAVLIPVFCKFEIVDSINESTHVEYCLLHSSNFLNGFWLFKGIFSIVFPSIFRDLIVLNKKI